MTKVCSKCGLDEGHAPFPKGPGKTCTPCESKARRERYAASPARRAKAVCAAEKYRKENPDKYRDAYLQREYGVSLEFYNGMLVAQGGKCAMCGGPPNGRGAKQGVFYVDHDHLTLRVRGLLCHGCNLVLGYVKDRVAVLQAGITYLLKDNK